MPTRISSSRASSSALIAAICAALVACHSTVSIPQSEGQLEGNPKVVTVTRKNGSQVTVYLPAIARDSLIGWLDEPMPDRQPQSRVAVSVADIQRISPTKSEHGVVRDVVTGTTMIVLACVVAAALALLTWGITLS